MMSVSVEMISPEYLPSMRTVPSKRSLPSNWLPLPRSALSSFGGRVAVGNGEMFEVGVGGGAVGAGVGCAIFLILSAGGIRDRVLTDPTRAAHLSERDRCEKQEDERLPCNET